MNWRDRLAITHKGQNEEPPKPTERLLAVLSVGSPAVLEPEWPVGLREHLLSLGADEGVQAKLVHALSDADLAACTGLPDAVLRAYLRALARSVVMDAGIVPEGYSQPAECDGCGPVLLWLGAPARVKACPWCFRRKAGKAVPRPEDLRGYTS